MSINHSIALKKNWAKMSAEERRKRMSRLGKRSAKKHGMAKVKLMVKSRLKKQKNANKK